MAAAPAVDEAVLLAVDEAVLLAVDEAVLVGVGQPAAELGLALGLQPEGKRGVIPEEGGTPAPHTGARTTAPALPASPVPAAAYGPMAGALLPLPLTPVALTSAASHEEPPPPAPALFWPMDPPPHQPPQPASPVH